MDMWGIDFMGPTIVACTAGISRAGNKYTRTLIDYATQKTWTCAIPEARGRRVVRSALGNVCALGIPSGDLLRPWKTI